MENKYKYLIERKDTNEWYRLNIAGYYGHTYGGEAFGTFPQKENDWTKDANDALHGISPPPKPNTLTNPTNHEQRTG
mgnify:FL=1